MDFLKKIFYIRWNTEDGETKNERQNGCDQESSNDEAAYSSDSLYD